MCILSPLHYNDNNFNYIMHQTRLATPTGMSSIAFIPQQPPSAFQYLTSKPPLTPPSPTKLPPLYTVPILTVTMPSHTFTSGWFHRGWYQIPSLSIMFHYISAFNPRYLLHPPGWRQEGQISTTQPRGARGYSSTAPLRAPVALWFVSIPIIYSGAGPLACLFPGEAEKSIEHGPAAKMAIPNLSSCVPLLLTWRVELSCFTIPPGGGLRVGGCGHLPAPPKLLRKLPPTYFLH